MELLSLFFGPLGKVLGAALGILGLWFGMKYYRGRAERAERAAAGLAAVHQADKAAAQADQEAQAKEDKVNEIVRQGDAARLSDLFNSPDGGGPNGGVRR